MSQPLSPRWMVCSACRKDIPFSTLYYVCSVSTCNRPATRLVFCSVPCWDSHIATLRHRDAWAVEELSPAFGAAASAPAPAPAPRIAAPLAPAVLGADPHQPLELQPADETEVLIVVSRMKKYIRERSGMNSSEAVAERLSAHVRALCDDAIRTAAREGRKTVLDRDVAGPRR